MTTDKIPQLSRPKLSDFLGHWERCVTTNIGLFYVVSGQVSKRSPRNHFKTAEAGFSQSRCPLWCYANSIKPLNTNVLMLLSKKLTALYSVT